MSDRTAKKRDADDEFARDLERKHEHLIGGGSPLEPSEEQQASPDDERVQSAMLVLELLEELKTDRGIAEDAVAETVADPSTKASLDARTEKSRQTQVESTIPNLKQLGRFKILQQIGRGGYGIVVRAYDPQLERDVAIKIPRFETALSEDSRVRFVREAKAAGSLNHPGVVTVHETCSEQGIDFIVTEFVGGENLATLLARGHKYSPRAAAELVAQLADAVEHAHQRGVLHRDIKPSNILLEDGPNPVPKIADFGLAFIVDEQDFTQTGAVVGTPAYMSPEQASGSKQAIGPHTDVYGLGTILYQLLTSKSPFAELTIFATIRAIVSKDPEAPRVADPTISKDLEAICLKCLEKDPARRYASAQLLQADLQRFLNQSPVVARRITRFDRVARWARRNPALATVSSLSFVALTIALILVTQQWRRAEQNVELANAQRIRAQRNVNRVGDTIDQMLNNVASSLRYIPQMSSLRKEILHDALSLQQELVSEESNDTRVRLDTLKAYRRMAQIQFFLGSYQDSLSTCETALERFAKPIESNNKDQWLIELAEVHFFVSEIQSYMDEPEEAAESIQTAINLVDSVDGSQRDDALTLKLSRMYRQLGITLEKQNQNDPALTAILASIELAKTVSNDAALAKAQNSAAIVYKKTGKMSEARTFYENAISTAQRVVEDRADRIELRSLVGTSSFNLGNLLHFQREFDEARIAYELSNSIYQDLANSFPQSSRFRMMAAESAAAMGLAYKSNGEYDQAEAAYLAAIEAFESAIREQVVPQRTISSLANTKSNLGNVYTRAGRDQEARAVFAEAVDDLKALVAKFPDVVGYRNLLSVVIGNMALVDADANLKAATASVNEALEIALTILKSSPDNPRYQQNAAFQCSTLVRLFFKLAQHDAAIESAAILVSINPESERYYHNAAKQLTGCLGMIKKDDQLSAESKIELAERYANAAMDYLQQSEEKGADLATLAESPDFEPLGTYDRFQGLVGSQ